MPLNYSWKEKVTHTAHSVCPFPSPFHAHMLCVCMNVYRETPTLEGCGTNLFAEKFQEGEVINSHKFNLFIKHSLSSITAHTIIKEL